MRGNFLGSLRFVETRVVIAAGNYTMENEVILIVNKTSGQATAVTLPANPSVGRTVFVKDGKGDAASNNITVSPASGNIDGASSYTQNANYECVGYLYNGTEWNVISETRAAP